MNEDIVSRYKNYSDSFTYNYFDYFSFLNKNDKRVKESKYSVYSSIYVQNSKLHH